MNASDLRVYQEKGPTKEEEDRKDNDSRQVVFKTRPGEYEV